MYLRSIPQEKIGARITRLARHERKITAVVVEHLAEVERRRLFIDWGFASLFEYIKRELGYSESAAWRRVEAARTLIAIPELKEDLETGALKLSQIVMAQKAIKEDQRVNGRMSLEDKREIFEEIRNKTSVETQKILDRDFDLPTPSIEKHKRDDSVELQIRLPREVFEKLMRVKELYSHSIPNGDWVAVVSQMADDVIKARDPLAKKPVAKVKVSQGATDETYGSPFYLSARSVLPAPKSRRFDLPKSAYARGRPYPSHLGGRRK